MTVEDDDLAALLTLRTIAEAHHADEIGDHIYYPPCGGDGTTPPIQPSHLLSATFYDHGNAVRYIWALIQAGRSVRRHAVVSEIPRRDEGATAFVQLRAYIEAVRGAEMTRGERDLVLDALISGGSEPAYLSEHQLVNRIAERDRYAANGIDSDLRRDVGSAVRNADGGWFFVEF